MTRLIVFIVLAFALVGIALVGLNQDHEIVITDATISRMSDGTIMASAKIANGGAPDTLVAVSATGFGHVHFMGAQGLLVVPGGVSPVLAGDGAHVMMMAKDDLAIGQLIPLNLTFQNAGEVTTRAKVVEPMMDHSGMSGIEAPNVEVVLTSVGDIGRDGLSGIVEISGIELVVRPNNAEHVAGEGHGHVYLNGLKLQRLYKPEFHTGELLPGDYVLRVSLNANDHRPYIKSGRPIAVELRFSVD